MRVLFSSNPFSTDMIKAAPRAPPPQAHLFDSTKKTINDVTALPASVQSGFYWPVGRHWAEIEEKQGEQRISD
jgi:hypothetical protein